MPLLIDTLTTALEPTRTAPDPATAAELWSTGLVTYLSMATPPLNPAVLDPAIRSALTPALMAPNPSPDLFCQALENALVSALTAAIPLAIPGVTPMVPMGLLTPLLLPIFASGMTMPDQAVVLQQLALTIDLWAKGQNPPMPAGVHYLIPGVPPIPTPLV